MSQTATLRQFHQPERDPFRSGSLSFSPSHLRSGDTKFRNRVHSPTLGMWFSNDPLEFEAGDVDAYWYVGNGPGNGLDALGLEEAVPVHTDWRHKLKNEPNMLPKIPIQSNPFIKYLFHDFWKYFDNLNNVSCLEKQGWTRI